MSRKIYLASSWRNTQQPIVLKILRDLGHEVYDFRNPPNNTGFGWQQCQIGNAPLDMHDMTTYIHHITKNEVAAIGFKSDRDALNWCDTCILLLPCGRSAYLEAGYAIGQGKETFIVLNKENFEPELMYLLSHHICETVDDLKVCLSHASERHCNVTYGWNRS